MFLFASAALCSCVGTSPEQEEPKVKKSLSEYMQDNKTNSKMCIRDRDENGP